MLISLTKPKATQNQLTQKQSAVTFHSLLVDHKNGVDLQLTVSFRVFFSKSETGKNDVIRQFV